VHSGCGRVQFRVVRSTTRYRIEIERETSGTPITLELAPALASGTTVTGARVNGVAAAYEVEETAHDVHPSITTSLDAPLVVEFDLRGGLEVVPPAHRPQQGAAPAGLRVIDVRRRADQLVIDVEGRASSEYVLALRGDDRVLAVEGAELIEQRDGTVRLRIVVPAGEDWVRRTLRLRVGQ
jgi:hypothetical protein